ncbi:MAG: hypothetical protein IPJ61_02050 [Tessaracoccus sp.]|uniref:hypothetical protein n=1 Tax=Tessaracoccus sp. TaxID=1971211 RepID=UPI001EC9755D|nr:hypothetical protein [Tessaracoccus sp.]MBK7819873.1 hypothetical protein [Tessaracoccus sp.]
MTATLIQIRGVAPVSRDVLASRAARNGQSLTAYLRDLLEREAATPQLDEVFGRIDRRSEVASLSSVDIVRRDREC